ncbi:Acetolactate synthase catalytic subunit, mitochondrial [Fusarium odoratissimum]|uniref:acetolactate synthase n=3 Tax=Fusarium oxysporum species complex TaxID=171631 RepID=N1RZM9_FUSC4|nr:acetolactate synthase I/II/III large subunit [Fusarium odoratissimum NRRL 54006]EMT69697.1 Acetolactate synthase catalytic subunit, mitochondrial [Fusarium odoratissimum]EXL93150.1 acetolactate synthase I/II/III large subunit [Fusarium odoratissimum NRRL 54006]TXC08794.1 hypothetical protein FocTR4_00002321 [Fusarium oxysporum f. sp. cubense]
MAQGYARASGKPGVLLVTSGPGVTNMVTPMQDALSDGTPLVVFCGQVLTTALGSDALQEADTIDISRACTKWNVMVRHIDELPQRINEAFEVATTGRPGPVLVDLPQDVTVDILRRPVAARAHLPSRSIRYQMAAETRDRQLEADLRRFARLINISRQPVIYAGQDVVLSKDGPQLLKQLADRCSIHVTTTLQGLGAFDEIDDKALHMLGLHVTAYANMSMEEAGLILALDARFDDRVTMNVSRFAPATYAAGKEGRGGIVHFEIVPKNINKVVQAIEAIEGDVAANLKRLLPLLKPCAPWGEKRRDWLRKNDEWKKIWPLSSFDRSSRQGLIQPQVVIEELDNLMADWKDNTYITTGVGQH